MAALGRYGVLREIGVEEVLAAPTREGYRVRAKLMVTANDAPRGQANGVAIGLYARATDEGEARADHVVVDIPECRVLHPELRSAAARLRALLARPPRAAAMLAPHDAGGRLSAVDLRYVQDPRGASGLLVTLVLEGAEPIAHTASVVDAIRDVGPVLGIAVNFRAPRAAQVLGPTTQWLWGARTAHDWVGKTYHLATYGSFVQAHRGQSERVAERIAAELEARRPLAQSRILDLYGGSGAMSLPLAALGAQVTLVESFAPAAECALRAAEEQRFNGFVAHTGDASAVAGRLAQSGARFDAVVVNPPRRGIDAAARRAIADLAPAAIAYLSCDADTLARDLADLEWLGFRVSRVMPIDMIPLTEHVEILAVLDKQPPRPAEVLGEDTDVRAELKRAHEPPVAGALWSPREDESGPMLIAKNGARSSKSAVATYAALVRGIARKKGTLGSARYERLMVVGGHSLLVWSSSQSSSHMRRALARVGHPVIGDRRFGDPATNRHFEEKHTLDRAFLHCTRIAWDKRESGPDGASSGFVAHAPLVDELGAVLAKFGIDAAKELMVG
jgi:23S rRNA (uracil1939-C5)-methyltransferase